MEKDNHNTSRREFIQKTTIAGAGLMLASPLSLFAQNTNTNIMNSNIKSRGYAGRNETDKLASWNFERRPVGDNDILIEIKYSGICHSDIHTIQGHWGKQQYPQVPGHEIAGIVTAARKECNQIQSGRQSRRWLYGQ